MTSEVSSSSLQENEKEKKKKEINKNNPYKRLYSFSSQKS